MNTQENTAVKHITLEEAKALTWRDTLYHTQHRNADGSPQRWRVNGKVKTWKREPNRVQIPIKYGLKSCDYLTERDLHLVTLTEKDALDPSEKYFQKHYATR